jgi:hypothetical protein
MPRDRPKGFRVSHFNARTWFYIPDKFGLTQNGERCLTRSGTPSLFDFCTAFWYVLRHFRRCSLREGGGGASSLCKEQ